ncbi:MAG: M18 family aminopeptidase [Parasporobacterium sp.]|nr:M18 family aminopeptidase [Parasporobacterium sp.]
MNTFDINSLNKELIDFTERSASMYHTVSAIEGYMDMAGFAELKEGESWKLSPGGRYYVTRNNSSIIAFSIGDVSDRLYFKIGASHSDSPSFALKDMPELSGPGSYLRLNVEGYGGMIDYSWLDRPLGIAGRVMVRTVKDGRTVVESRLINPDEDLFIIPSLCIHFNRDVNKGFAFNHQVDMCPLVSSGQMTAEDFRQLIADYAGAEVQDITGMNLFLVNRQKGRIWGARKEFVSAGHLDDLQCAFTSMKGFLRNLEGGYCANEQQVPGVNVFACFDNEEVGSGTKQGALSTFLSDTLRRICMGLDRNEEDYLKALAGSFMISSDNAHALHPNHPEKSDPVNTPMLNKGIVIKENASQKYCTDAFSRSIFRAVCDDAGVPYQSFANRSDVPGGSTLGNLSCTKVSMHAVDIGLPQLAMHSAYETAGTMDTVYGAEAFARFYGSDILIEGSDRASVSLF